MRRNLHKTICCALACAALTVAAGCGAFSYAPASQSGVVINEVVTSNRRSLTDDAVGSPDWIELYNPSDRAVSLKGYGLTDNVKALHKYVFDDISIAPGGYLVLYAAENNGVNKTDAPCTGYKLNKNGDSLILTDPYYGLIAELELPPLYTDVSYALNSDGTYGYCGVPTPGAPNTEPIADSLEGVFAGRSLEDLALSEALPVSADGMPWVEVVNNGDGALRLDSYYLSDSEDNIMRWQMPSVALPAGGRACIYLTGLGEDGEGGDHADFRLGKRDTCLILADQQGRVVDELRWEAGIPTGISVLHGAEGTAYTAFPTFGEENAKETFDDVTLKPMTSDDPIRINEVLCHNTLSVVDEDGDRCEWAELRNTSAATVLLHGYFLSDDADDLFKWALPDVSLDAGECLLIFLSGKDLADTNGELHASFRLSDGETSLFLTTIDGMRCDELPLADAAHDNVSVGRDADGSLRYYAYPTPGYENGNGVEKADSIGFFNTRGVFISEVCAAHEIKSDERDWIELYNGGDAAVTLDGWTLSDDPDAPDKWTITGVTIQPGAYAVIEANVKDAAEHAYIAPFGLRAAGETLVLSDPNGVIADAFETGVLTAELTSGRIVDDPSLPRVFFKKATKARENSGSYAYGRTAQPVYSDTALYRVTPFELTITCRTRGASIYYTTDGSVPTQSSARYDGPIAVTQSMTVRAAAYADGLLTSDGAAATYLFVEPHTLPVVCIAADPGEIKDLLRTTDRKNKVEREALLAYYEADGSLGTMFPAGIKPKGAGTLVYAQKSMSIQLRGGYGQSSVTYPFFEDTPFTTFSALALRNGGQDWDDARIRDSYCARLVQGMMVENALTRPVVVYINGVYYGLYDLNEDQNKEYFATHYGADKDALDIIRRNSTVLEGSDREILRVRSYAKYRNLRKDDAYAEFCQWIDVEYFTDYFIAQTYFCNSDMFNQKYWRAQDYSYKWRPILYDLDFAFVSAKRDIINQYFNEEGVPSADQSLTYFEIYVGLNKNESWRAYCVERYVQVMMEYFNAERAAALLDDMAETIRPEMARHIARWGEPRSLAQWERNVQQLRDVVTARPEYALENLRYNFGLSRSYLEELKDKYAMPASVETETQGA